MIKKRYGKLVRDNVPDEIRKKGNLPSTRAMDEDEFRRELLYKLIDSAEEARQAGYNAEADEFLHKLADVQEVLNAVLEEFNIDEESFKRMREMRLNKLGSFKGKTFLESVQEE
ncbi:MAG: nucleoside triphosphate pyrophosphohydrolase [bacterium]|nr:nucleoside triphosphate pyrophosphohydrolase [bacterium]